MKEYSVDYISDLHVDYWVRNFNLQDKKHIANLEEYIEMLGNSSSDILIIAGDVSHYNYQIFALFELLLNKYQEIIFVPGNHEMYLISNSISKKFNYNSFNRLDEIKAYCDLNPRLHYLDGNTVNINGLIIGGTGMWHDNSYGKLLKFSDHSLYNLWKTRMQDARYIMQYKTYHDNYDAVIKKSSFDYIKHFKVEMHKMKKINEADILVSHYGPIISPESMKRYSEVDTTFFYYNGTFLLNKLKPKLYIYGHVHSQYIHFFGETKLVCNPLGRPSENTYATIKTEVIRKDT